MSETITTRPTRQEVRDEPAGPRLDAWVAQHVMGWTPPLNVPDGRWRFDDDAREWVHASGQRIAADALRKSYKWQTPDGGLRDEVPRFSADIAAAWEVVGKFGGMRMDATLPASGIDVEFDSGPKASGDTAPLAICRAAMVAWKGGR